MLVLMQNLNPETDFDVSLFPLFSAIVKILTTSIRIKFNQMFQTLIMRYIYHFLVCICSMPSYIYQEMKQACLNNRYKHGWVHRGICRIRISAIWQKQNSTGWTLIFKAAVIEELHVLYTILFERDWYMSPRHTTIYTLIYLFICKSIHNKASSVCKTHVFFVRCSVPIRELAFRFNRMKFTIQ